MPPSLGPESTTLGAPRPPPLGPANQGPSCCSTQGREETIECAEDCFILDAVEASGAALPFTCQAGAAPQGVRCGAGPASCWLAEAGKAGLVDVQQKLSEHAQLLVACAAGSYVTCLPGPARLPAGGCSSCAGKVLAGSVDQSCQRVLSDEEVSRQLLPGANACP